MKVIGLAGESGTGKSTIATHLKAKGAGHIDADRVGHEVLDGDPGVRERIRDSFGPDVFKGECVDRVALSRLVFGDPEALASLNAIIHPAIVRVCESRIEEFKKNGAGLVVIDAALLLEVPLPFKVDLMIALSCSRDEQLSRLQAKGGFSLEQIEARLAAQGDVQKSFYRANVVVDTGKPVPVVLSEIERLIDSLPDTTSR